MAQHEIDLGLLWGGLLAAIAALAAALRWIVRTARPTNGHEREMQQHMEAHIQRLEDRLRLAEIKIASLEAHND